jgi:hypothetical protein
MASKKDEKKPAAAPARPARGAKEEAKPAAAAEPEVNETLARLVDAADNLNTVLGLEPAIDLELGEEELKSAISAEAKLIGVDTKTDKVTDAVIAADKKALKPETWALLEELGMLGHIKPAAKEDAKPARGAAAKPAAAKPAPKDKPAKTAKEGKKTMTRTACFCAALMEEGKKGVSLTDLAKYTDEDFVKAGGGSNLKQTEYMIKVHLPVLTGCGFVEYDSKGIITLKK